jgi:Na+-transporting NADH:ubiquinone oxidoreductase subunit A
MNSIIQKDHWSILFGKYVFSTMKSIPIQNGFNLKVAGVPALECEKISSPERVSVLPDKIPYIKPRLGIREGDPVDIGSELFFDKRHPEIKFCAPGSGRIEKIAFGRRRVIEEIVIRLKDKETYKEFPAFSERDLTALSRDTVIESLSSGGLWPLIRELPFRDIARVNAFPPMIIVSLSAEEPFLSKPGVYLDGKGDLFAYGLKVLNLLCPGKVIVSVHRKDADAVSSVSEMVTHVVSGKYPADDPGVLHFHLKTSPDENRGWFIHGQDLLLVAEFLQTGRFPTERIIAVGGNAAGKAAHFKARLGSPIDHLVKHTASADGIRYVVGGIFTGYPGSIAGFIGLYERGLTVIPEGTEREFLMLIQPGFNKPSYSRAFLSWLNTGNFQIDGNIHGGVRACIACNHCMEVCPVKILPQLTYKAILAGEIEEALAHGLLDCVECGLCAYVCPSKIELTEVLKAAKKDYYLEQA